jgi:hypothetical protein
VDSINLNGEFITHKAFGRGQIVEHGDGFVEVLFSEKNETKKFIYPSAIQTFLKLESDTAAKQYKTFSDGIARDHAQARKDAADKLSMEKQAVLEHAKQLKKAMKKSVKKIKEEIDYYET